MFDKFTLSSKDGKTSVEISVFQRKDVEMEFFVKCPDCIIDGIDKDFLKSFETYLRQVVFQDYGQIRQGYLITFATKIGELLSSILYLKMSDFKAKIKFVMDEEKDTVADYEQHLTLQTIEIL